MINKQFSPVLLIVPNEEFCETLLAQLTDRFTEELIFECDFFGDYKTMIQYINPDLIVIDYMDSRAKETIDIDEIHSICPHSIITLIYYPESNEYVNGILKKFKADKYHGMIQCVETKQFTAMINTMFPDCNSKLYDSVIAL